MGLETAGGLIEKVEELVNDELADAEAHRSALRMLSTAEMLTRDPETARRIRTVRHDIHERYGDPDEGHSSFGV